MEFTQLLVDVATLLPGLIAFLVVLVNILKHFGVVKDGETFAASVQLVVSIVLTAAGLFFPNLFDWFPYIDQIAEVLAELGGFVIPLYAVIVKLANVIHDLLTKFSFLGVNRLVAKQLTP